MPLLKEKARLDLIATFALLKAQKKEAKKRLNDINGEIDTLIASATAEGVFKSDEMAEITGLKTE